MVIGYAGIVLLLDSDTDSVIARGRGLLEKMVAPAAGASFAGRPKDALSAQIAHSFSGSDQYLPWRLASGDDTESPFRGADLEGGEGPSSISRLKRLSGWTREDIRDSFRRNVRVLTRGSRKRRNSYGCSYERL